MSFYKELEYASKIRDIVAVQFSVLSPKEIKRRSVVHVTQTHLYEPNGDAVIGGLFDPRMGVIDHGKICPTDGMDNRFSPGYFGHIELVRPVFYIQFLERVKKILKCVCFRCSKLLIDPEDVETKEILNILKGIKRWNYIIEKCSKVKSCGSASVDGCGATQPHRYGKEGGTPWKIFADWGKENNEEYEARKQFITAEYVLKIFKRISDEDCEAMGLSRKWCRPDWLICQNLPVAPPSVRPSIRQFSGVRSEDDITHKFVDIIKTNNQLKKKLESGTTLENIIDDWTQVLQYHVATLIDNEIPSINPSTHRSGRVLKTLRQRLKGKEGRIRGNLQGKRVNFSARSVITPDPNISIDQLGVPKKIAMNLTFPDIVTKYNKNKLLKLVRNGPMKYPGAKSVQRQVDGRTTNLHFVDTQTIELELGDVVHRHLLDDDTILFNRQPSLHKMSMMGHRVKVIYDDEFQSSEDSYYTFRMNLSVTKPYNADFDGDEMNLHVPQSLQTSIELKEITAVPLQIISPREHKPVIGLFQDSILGLNRITNDNIYFTKNEMMNILIYIPHFNGELPVPVINEGGKQRWDGRQLISFALPKGLNATIKNNSYDDVNGKDDLNIVKIVDGVLISGRIDSGVMNKGSNGLIHVVFNDFGPKVCQQFLDDLQNIITRYLILSGFSVGISDLIADKDTNEKIKQSIVKKKKDVSKLVQQVHQQIFENNGNNSISVEFEKKVNMILNKAISEAGKIGLKSLSSDNRMTNMVSSGSKGKPINISQMVSCLGQQNVDGKRIPNGYNDRTLPHFTKYNVSPESKGFVENSFVGGLTPQEFFFHAMGGREGLIDTAVKSITGDTKLIIIENNKPMNITIGDWINNHLENNKGNITYYGEEDANMELLDISKNNEVFIPTTDNSGNMSWAKITNITRHDPGEFIYTIKTKSGRNVSVVESKSLLIWNENKKEYEPKDTKDIQTGDRVPVSVCLPNNLQTITNINLTRYLPKNEFIYGTDFNKARECVKSALSDRKKVPDVWWINNNGKDFELPYTKSAMFIRTLNRSNVNYIKDGCIYPYSAKRNNTEIEDNFELNHENGLFIGLYLAEGTSHISSGKVLISNNDKTILNIVEKWFDKRNIVHKTYVKNGNNNSTSTSIQGSSTILAKFLTQLVGQGARHKFIPAEFQFAPDDFIKGLIDGYYSGDGTISKNSIDVSSASKDLINGISMLLTRFGIYSKMTTSILKKNNFNTINIAPINRLSVRSIFAKKFSNTFTFTHTEKQDKLMLIASSRTLLKYKDTYHLQNDTILDEIVSIDKCPTLEHPKVYDLTVPSTKNFGLANGLQVYDTSETGYIQRKLIKAMEDLKIYHNLGVRNANGNIVQFLYGEDGMDYGKIESQRLPYLETDKNRLIKDHQFAVDDDFQLFMTPIAIKNMEKTKDYMNKLNDYFKIIKEDAYHTRMYIFPDYRDTTINFPVNLKRIIGNMKMKCGILPNMLSDLNPLYVIEKTNELSDNLKATDVISGTKLFTILIRCYLSPKMVIKHHRLTKFAFDHIIQTIQTQYYDSLIQPGEMVGPIAAQSIGEPATQMTLNSVTYETPILIKNKDNQILKYEIGDFTTNMINRVSTENIQKLKNDTTYAECDDDYLIESSNENGDIVWSKVIAVTKHPVINKDGTNTMLEIKTKGNRAVIATKAKSFLQCVDGKILPVNGDELKVGDYLPVSNKHGDYNKKNKIPNIINGRMQFENRDGRFKDIIFDEIISIEEVENTTEYAYDLTVEGTKNFNIYNGICMRDTFHFAGVAEKSNVTRGVPRLKELFGISKKPKIPSLTVYLEDEYRYSKDKSMGILNEIGVTSLKDIAKSMRIYYDPIDYHTNVEEDRELLEIYNIFNKVDCVLTDENEGSDWIIRFEFDKQIMIEKDITMADVYSKIHQHYNERVYCIYSDDNSNKLIFRIRLMKTKKKDALKKEMETIQDLNNIKNLAKDMRESVIIKGIEGIKNVSMYKNKQNYIYENESFVSKEEWVLDTNGINLLEVLRYPGVNSTRTISNDIYEVYNTFGIEVAKSVLLKEIRDVISEAGSYVNYRHLNLLVDTMTYRGYLMSVDRFGINRSNIGPLAKCSFEEATVQLFTASIFGETDKLNGVSANIMMGQIPSCGTGQTDVLFDESKIIDIKPEDDEEVDDIENWNELDYCDTHVNIDFTIDNEDEVFLGDAEELNEMVYSAHSSSLPTPDNISVSDELADSDRDSDSSYIAYKPPS